MMLGRAGIAALAQVANCPYTVDKVERGGIMGIEQQLIGIGLYSFPEASRLSKVKSQTIRRWVHGYRYFRNNETRISSPVWESDAPEIEGHDGISFFDLIEVRFVAAFRSFGVAWPEIRRAANEARDLFNTRHPFANEHFATDGRYIFLEMAKEPGHEATSRLLQLGRSQYAFDRVIRPSLRGVEYVEEMAARWYPLYPKKQVILDPKRSFGQPIVEKEGVPTDVLAKSALVEGSAKRAASIFDVSASAVEAAVLFEEQFAA
jgi:uncharacterized protein (DUF433 family)